MVSDLVLRKRSGAAMSLLWRAVVRVIEILPPSTTCNHNPGDRRTATRESAVLPVVVPSVPSPRRRTAEPRLVGSIKSWTSRPLRARDRSLVWGARPNDPDFKATWDTEA